MSGLNRLQRIGTWHHRSDTVSLWTPETESTRKWKMEALVCEKLGDPGGKMDENSPIVLSKNYPIPQLDSTTAVRVRVKATSLNYANYLQILGKYQEKPPLPFVPGSDYSGIVDAVGPNVSIFKVGDRVCSFASLGSFAQFIVADQSQL